MPRVNLQCREFAYPDHTRSKLTPPSVNSRAQRSSGPLCCALLLSLVTTGACVGSGVGIPDAAGNTGDVPTTFEEIELLVFEPMCAVQCHKGGAAPQGLNLEVGRSLDGLVGVSSNEVPGMLRIAPGQPNESYLITKLVPFDARRTGQRMPRNGPPYLTDPQLRALKRWITAGATDDWEDTGELIDAGVADAAPPLDAIQILDAGGADAPPPDAG